MTRRSTARNAASRRAGRRGPALLAGTAATLAALISLTAPAATSEATTEAASPRAAAVGLAALDRDELEWVDCPQGGGSIGVAPWLADDVRDLLEEGMDDGVPMCGRAWRSYERQVELRFQNCGVSTKAVYDWPSGWCSPPTARPGTSMHEKGLAIDFRPLRGVSRSDMYEWLREHAPDHGLYQLPSENWHYSTTGH